MTLRERPLGIRRCDRVVALGLLACLTACDPYEEIEPPPEAAVWSLSATPVFEAGAENSDPLFGVSGALRLEDGTVVVANSGSRELFYYSADGQRVRTVGGRGRGPQEFAYMGGIRRLAGDTVLVFGGTYGQVTLVDPNGQVVHRSNSVTVRINCRLAERPAALASDGSLVWRLNDNLASPECGPRPAGAWRMTGLVLRSDWRSLSVDTLGVFPSSERIE